MLAFSREGGIKNLPTGGRGGGEFKNHENLLKSLMNGPLTLPGPGGGRFGHPLVSVICCALSFSIMISTCPWKIFFSNFFQLLWENWPRMTKTKKCLVSKNEKTLPILFQNWMTIFLRIFLRYITHSSRSKNKDFRKSSWFSDFFSKNAYSSLKLSNFEVQKSYISQKNL